MPLPQHIEDIRLWKLYSIHLQASQCLTEISHRQERTVSFQRLCARAEKWEILSWCMEPKTKGTWLQDHSENDVSAFLFVWMVLFFLIFLRSAFKDVSRTTAFYRSIPSSDLGGNGRCLHQSPNQPRTGANDATNNIITALVHISLIWQKPSLNRVPPTKPDAPLLGFIVVINIM